jgi:hypothetical protein
MNETAHGFPRQQQPRPGHEAAMDPAPVGGETLPG